MSLYYEAAAILTNTDEIGGSLKSRIYGKKDLKSSPANVYALVSETTKWSSVLKDVVEHSGLLREEKKLNPALALLLTHDTLLSKKGLAAPTKHPLRQTIERHKTRLNAEFTKLRIQHAIPSIEAFRTKIESGWNGGLGDEQDQSALSEARHPRWIRINTLRTTLEKQLQATFAGYEKRNDIGQILAASAADKVFFLDDHIPNLVAVPPQCDLSKTKAYRDGEIIFQDKASCFPAYLLDSGSEHGDVIDSCAAPGNKTTHIAAILTSSLVSKDIGSAMPSRRVFAFERDKYRAKTLQKMVTIAGADNIVTVRGNTDFLTVDPMNPTFENVGALLLDPSCSGSGIVGRDDQPKLLLPNADSAPPKASSKSKKRKRSHPSAVEETPVLPGISENDTNLNKAVLSERLTSLSAFQLQLLQHAMRFPNAKKITYSTCSVHSQENEAVVIKALACDVAIQRGWRILSRGEQVEGLQKWAIRGDKNACAIALEENNLARKVPVDTVADACICCKKGTKEGTMGFFVAGFVRSPRAQNVPMSFTTDEEEEWTGFSDDEHATLSEEMDSPAYPVRENRNVPKTIPTKSVTKGRQKNWKELEATEMAGSWCR